MITRIYHPDAGQIQVLGRRQRGGSGVGSDRISAEERGLYRKMPVG